MKPGNEYRGCFSPGYGHSEDERNRLSPERLPEESGWDFSQMSPQALMSTPATPKPGTLPRCVDGQHTSGWYVGYACQKCGDVD